MAKSDNKGQKLFGTEFNGFSKKQVTEYIANLEKKYNEVIQQKDAEVKALHEAYNELQDKYAESFDSYMVLQEEKSKIADVLIGAENRATEIVDNARMEAEKERAVLEAQAEILRETIVDKNKILKDMKESANSLFAEFETQLNSKIQDIFTVINSGLDDLNSKADLIISDVAAKSDVPEDKVAEDSDENSDIATDEIISDEQPKDVSEEKTDGPVSEELQSIFSDDEQKENERFAL